MDALLRKIKIRSEIINLCSTLSPIYKKNAIEMLSNHLQEVIKDSEKICIYRARDWEPSLDLVIQQCLSDSEKKLYQPRATVDNKNMLCERYMEKENRLFVQNNNKLDESNLIEWHELDVILFPLVAIDKRGTRLGRGGGYYDTSLHTVKKKNPKIIFCGIGYSCQVVSDIPQEKHDICLDYFVSQNGVINFNRKYFEDK
jgi:5-formyltetrahydrofolate cyclo-ligase